MGGITDLALIPEKFSCDMKLTASGDVSFSIAGCFLSPSLFAAVRTNKFGDHAICHWIPATAKNESQRYYLPIVAFVAIILLIASLS